MGVQEKGKSGACRRQDLRARRKQEEVEITMNSEETAWGKNRRRAGGREERLKSACRCRNEKRIMNYILGREKRRTLGVSEAGWREIHGRGGSRGNWKETSACRTSEGKETHGRTMGRGKGESAYLHKAGRMSETWACTRRGMEKDHGLEGSGEGKI